ncbi:MAG: MerR family transcriptional regulator [Solirubrobacterales bacterium]
MSETELTIGQVAERAGVATSAIRYYERIGVLPPADRVSGQRRYGRESVDRLKTIAVAQRAGFKLDEIGELLRGAEKGEASVELRALAQRKLPEVEDLIARAERMRGWLEVASECGCPTLDECGLFDVPEPASAELTVVPGRLQPAV